MTGMFCVHVTNPNRPISPSLRPQPLHPAANDIVTLYNLIIICPQHLDEEVTINPDFVNKNNINSEEPSEDMVGLSHINLMS